MINAVIFDMDGLMFDTEVLAMDAWIQVGKEMNFPIDEALVYRVIGKNNQDVKAECLRTLGDTFPYEDFRKGTSAYMKMRIDREGLPVKPGLRELLTYLKEHDFRTAVASSSSRDTVKDYLRRTELTEYFDSLVCGDMVTRGKPEPDIFLIAAKELNAELNNCLILEDSKNGIRAAAAAGIYRIMIPDLIAPDEELKGLASEIRSSLFDIIPFLEEENRRKDL